MVFLRLVDVKEELKQIMVSPTGKNLIADEKGGYYLLQPIPLPVAKQRITVIPTQLVFDEILESWLNKVFNHSIGIAAAFSPEPIELGKNDLFSPIRTLFQRLVYKTPESVFHFAADLFIEVAMAHRLINGNKRVAFAFLISTLYFLGFDFFGLNRAAAYTVFAKRITGFVESMKNRSDENSLAQRQATKQEVVNWIKENTVVCAFGI